LITVFLGAGFSHIGGVPLAHQLFDEEPLVDRVVRARLVNHVLHRWNTWKKDNQGTPEEYLAYLQDRGGKPWDEANWYVGLVIALKMGVVQMVGFHPTIIRHHLTLTSGIASHESFWTILFQHTYDIGVVTTNYDILAERGLRNEPRPRLPRPGFNYGFGYEELEGRGFPARPSFLPVAVSGKVPLLKLHGSISWAIEKGNLVKYLDCRPAVRGNPAIIAPITEKKEESYLTATWTRASEVLSTSKLWLIVGYSLPEYDSLVRDLFVKNSRHQPIIHVLDPNPAIVEKYASLLPKCKVYPHPGLPQALSEMSQILAQS